MSREHFSSRSTAVLAMAGSAIGLGNIWRFPYMVGENGGAAFILVYLLATLLLSLPIFFSESIIGRATHQGTIGAMKALAPGTAWRHMGLLTVLSPLIILSFYSVVGGWSVEYLLTHFAGMQGRLMEGDFLQLKLEKIFPERFAIIGNFPYNISSQIFFKVLDYKDRIPEVVGMVQKEVAERLAEGPGSKTYGILSVLLQAWYDIEYLFTVGSGCFAPPPKVESAVIRLTRNGRTSLGCDEALFKTVVKTAFGQRRKMMRNPLKPLARAKAERCGWSEEQLQAFLAQEVFSLRPEKLSVEDFVALTNLLA